MIAARLECDYSESTTSSTQANNSHRPQRRSLRGTPQSGRANGYTVSIVQYHADSEGNLNQKPSHDDTKPLPGGWRHARISAGTWHRRETPDLDSRQTPRFKILILITLYIFQGQFWLRNFPWPIQRHQSVHLVGSHEQPNNVSLQPDLDASHWLIYVFPRVSGQHSRCSRTARINHSGLFPMVFWVSCSFCNFLP